MTNVNISGLELARQFVQRTTSMNSIDIRDEDPIRVPAGHLRGAAAELQRLISERDELAAKLAEIERAEPVAWSPALTHTDYEKTRVWCNGKPRDEDVAYWKSQGIGITLAYSHPTAPQPVAVPAGWKLVPVAPTPEMVQAANDGDDEYTLRGFGPGVQRVMQGPEDHYVAMLSAAPQPPAAEPGYMQQRGAA